MNKIKAVIFDLDGVLISTDHYHFKAWKKIANQLNIEFDEEMNHLLRGVSRIDSLNIILNHSSLKLSDSEKNLIAEEKNQYYVEFLQELNEKSVEQDVLYTLTKLKEMGYKLAIGSSSKNAEYILDQTKLKHFFDALSDGNNITQSKPNPEVFLKAASYLMEKPENCLVIEDAISGIEAGYKAGMRTVGIGQATKSSLANYKINKLSEILKIVEG